MMTMANAPTPAKQARRARQRKARRARDRAALVACRNGGSSVAESGSAPMRSMGMSYSAVDGSGEYVPNVNFEPSLPSLVRRGGADRQLLAQLGSTENGRLWALKASHPNGEEVTASAGIPDHTNVPVATPELRSIYTITGDSTQTGNDDVDIVMLPCNELAFMYRRYTSGSSPYGAWEGWNFVFYPSLAVGTESFQAIDAKEKKFDVQYWTTSLIDYGRSRCMYNGITVHLDSPTLADQGRVIGAQLPFEMRTGQATGVYFRAKDTVGTAITPNTQPTAIYNLPDGFPFDEPTLFQTTPGAVQWEAREGIYMPMRFKEPVHLFQADMAETMFVVKADDVNTGIFGAAVGYTKDKVERHLPVGVPNNMLGGIILFRGVDKRANLNVKTRLGLETLVERPSEVSPFQHMSPVLDQLAIDQVTRLSQASPMGYPADYNDFSSILGVIKGVLSNIVKPVSGALKDLGIPIVSNIAGGVNSVISSLGLAPRRRNRRNQIQMLGSTMRY